jgi:DNA end-binding protein Ku
MKAIWQGSLVFGLVNIPVALYSAIKPHVLGFTMLCGACNRPISLKKWCNHCKKEVACENIVKGLELKKGTYFILSKEKLHSLKPEKTDTLDIIEFVDPSLIDTLYLDTHYYLAPKKNDEKAFFLFEKALSASQKIAVGQFVMKEKEHVCIILPHANGLLLTTLNYSYEIRDSNAIEALKYSPEIDKQELDLAVKIIEQRTKKTFKLERFKDHFAEKLLALLKKKTGKKMISLHEQSREIAQKSSSLLTSLKASLKKPAARSKKKNA